MSEFREEGLAFEEQLSRLEDFCDDAFRLPIPDKAVVSISEIETLISSLRESLPSALTEAQEILLAETQIRAKADEDSLAQLSMAESKAETLITRAQADAREIIQEAEARSMAMVQNHEVFKQAEDEARKLMDKATTYSDKILAELEQELGQLLPRLRRIREELGEHRSVGLESAEEFL